MILLSSIIKTFEKSFIARYGSKLSSSQRQTLSGMRYCRSKQSPKMLVECADCDQQLYVPHSCGHRNCPHCQAHESQQWLERQLKKQVPADYFLVTFTLPAQFRELAWSHRRTLFDLMLRLSWDTLKTFSRNDKQLQGVPGAIAVLHTHSRCLGFHPHVHVVIPAGAIDRDKRLIQILQLICKLDPNRALAWVRKRPPMVCSCCGGAMTIIKTRIRSVFAHYDTLVPS
jgi:hypothetical protein